MIAERDHVDAGFKEFVGNLWRNSESACHVLAIDDDERWLVALTDRWQQCQKRAAPAAADKVANEADCCLI